MQKNTYPGKFIVFEGIDGSGQSTQADLLKEWLSENGYPVLLTKEPTQNSDAGKRIRKIVEGKDPVISHKGLQELFIQDRREHLDKFVIPALKKGIWVVCDRYFFSTLAYGAAEGVNIEWLIKQNSEFLFPDIIFFLQIDPAVSVERIQKRGRIISIFEKLEKLKGIRQKYDYLALRFPCVVSINGEELIERVARNVQQIIKQRLL